MADTGEFYTPKDACTAVGMPRGTLDTWTARGLTRAFEGQSVQVGKARAFSKTDVMALALIKAGLDVRIEAIELASVAPDYARKYLAHDGRVNQLVLRFYGIPGADDSRISILPNDDVLSSKPSAGARITITFDLPAIFDPVLSSLHSLTAKA